MTQNVSGIVAGVVVCVVVLLSIAATSLTPYIKKRRDRRRHKNSVDEEKPAQAAADMADVTTRNKKRPAALPLYKTRGSLTRSTDSSPVNIVTPGIRFTITSPSHMSRKTTSVESLPSIEAALEEHEQDLDEVDLSEDARKDSLTVPAKWTDEGVVAECSAVSVVAEKIHAVDGPIAMLDNTQQEHRI